MKQSDILLIIIQIWLAAGLICASFIPSIYSCIACGICLIVVIAHFIVHLIEG